ncbi:hypothetical protein [Polaribacter sp. Z022]|uniref:hypothetical protein n=1 Tax=Polaribacter sp. Z022 TaxID=2927125 RepID=UPI0020205AC6|nr:hypothetical protein [Polaribacter sp. Z022]MCL7752448.1 hypothetical protein [Polaribacter sp. Z022]
MEKKKAFLVEEIWLLTFGGAFQHSGIYKTNTKEKDRTNFRNMLQAYIEQTILKQYKQLVSDEEHIENIMNISSYTSSFKKILKAPINIGISQKLLNLVLKYYWCLEILPEPPHFPVDRIIQQKIYKQPLVNWTQLNDIDTYIQIINDARDLAKKQSLSLAQWELENFNRR